MKKIISIIIITMALTGCTRINPFMEEWDTPYGIPPFDKIENEDFMPAIKAGIEEQQKEITAITSNTEKPTFANTIEPLEHSGELLGKVVGVLYNIIETDRTDELDSIVEEATPLITANDDSISFNKALFKRIEIIYNTENDKLNREQQMVLKKNYESFIRNGVSLPEDKQAELTKINSEMALKTQKIGNNILAENNLFTKKFGIDISEYPTAMTTTKDRSKRQEMQQWYSMRGHNGNEYDTRALFMDVFKLRLRKAQILGYPNTATYVLEDKMAHDPQTVDAFLDNIMKAANKRARQEVADMQLIMDEDIKAGLMPQGSKIEPWDWWYYAERVRKQKYDLDENLTKPYFLLKNVVKGAFLAAHKLYGINMEEIHNVPIYNPEVTTYKVTAEDGSLIGIFTTDYKPRPSKRGGAWMNNIRSQYYDMDGNNVRPIIVNVANMGDSLTIDDVLTVFHEFGHALHGLLTQCHYETVSGTNVTHDYVEMFSQFNENWAFQPELLKEYAINDKGEVIPEALVEKINNSLKFNQGFMTAELCAASILDMKWHELESYEGIDIDEFEKKVISDMQLIPEIVPRYKTTYYNHLCLEGYYAGYYGYLWSEVLHRDAFAAFQATGNVWDKEMAKRFKETFLEKGGSEEPMTLYKSFMGREPDSKAFFKARGLDN